MRPLPTLTPRPSGLANLPSLCSSPSSLGRRCWAASWSFSRLPWLPSSAISAVKLGPAWPTRTRTTAWRCWLRRSSDRRSWPAKRLIDRKEQKEGKTCERGRLVPLWSLLPGPHVVHDMVLSHKRTNARTHTHTHSSWRDLTHLLDSDVCIMVGCFYDQRHLIKGPRESTTSIISFLSYVAHDQHFLKV